MNKNDVKSVLEFLSNEEKIESVLPKVSEEALKIYEDFGKNPLDMYSLLTEEYKDKMAEVIADEHTAGDNYKLSIEEKAKAYDGLIERLKDLKFAYRFSPLSDTIEEKFPELKESEDESIKKEIIAFLKEGKPYHCPNSAKRQEWAAWLEKQCDSDETKAKTFLINKGYPIDTNGIFPTYEKMYNIIREGLEKQGEQNLLDNVAKQLTKDKETATSFLRSTGIINENGELAEPYRVCESTSSWSEEDEEMFGYLEDMVAFCYRNQYVVNVQTCESVRQLVFRLKSLCFQSGWGKDDITRINEIIETLNIVQANRVRTQRMHYNKATIDKNIDWLKALKDRVGKFDDGYKVGFSAAKYNQWKPSKEQIETLEQWLRENRYKGNERFCYPMFDSLYNDLKKLMEE